MLNKRSIKKYYIGSRNISDAIDAHSNASCTFKTIEEAIAEAKELVEINERKCAIVVEIKAIVLPEKKPIKVMKL